MEGELALKRVYDEICHANSIRFWSNLATFENLFKENFDKISAAIHEQKIQTREIIANTPEARKSSKKYAARAGTTYSSRIATKDGIQNDNAIYGGVVALFRIHQLNFFVVRIEDQTIADAMKSLFDMAWQSAEEFI